MSKDITIGIVGKPSAGKSSFLNSISEAAAKVGNYPFTTIEPNKGIAYVTVNCPCKKFEKPNCRPRTGKCIDGLRSVPLNFLDVAGLVPGASKGAGLGNQFLNDLTRASCLIHVVDVSGTTDAAGKNTIGYDPSNDIDWLFYEIHEWIFANIWNRWQSVVQKHVKTKATIVDTLQKQLGGYGSDQSVMLRVLGVFNCKEPLEKWDQDLVKQLVTAYCETRFPTIIALNKIDLPESDKNISKILDRYKDRQENIILTSALAEIFLRKLHKQKFINYHEATEFFDTAQDSPDAGLKPLDEKTKGRLEKIQDLILFRYGSTGVQNCLQQVVELLGLVPVYPVKNVNNFGSGRKDAVFCDCFFVTRNTTMRQLAHLINPELDKRYNYTETVGNVRLAEDDIVNLKNNIVSIRTKEN